uniref:Uncharacterized protein n=1 Tax=Opuntia streptacantha TaxID=393608 RepID=A0A7C9D084_OPUST
MMDVRVAGVLGLLFYPSCLFVVSLSRWDWGGQGLFKSKGYNGGPRKTKQVFVEVMDLEDLKCFTCRENRRQRAKKWGGEGEKEARITRNGHVALDPSLKFYEGESKVKSSKTGVTNSGIRRFIGRQPLLEHLQ